MVALFHRPKLSHTANAHTYEQHNFIYWVEVGLPVSQLKPTHSFSCASEVFAFVSFFPMQSCHCFLQSKRQRRRWWKLTANKTLLVKITKLLWKFLSKTVHNCEKVANYSKGLRQIEQLMATCELHMDTYNTFFHARFCHLHLRLTPIRLCNKHTHSLSRAVFHKRTQLEK